MKVEWFKFRLKKSNEMQQYADIYLLLNYSTCFGRPSRPSSGVHKTVLAVSGTDDTVLYGERASSNVTNLVKFDHTIWEVSFFKHDQM
jgi:hypothetical protein